MATFTGGPGTDILIGSEDADVIQGLGGNDSLDGRGGNDTIDGGDGDDFITGGLGADTLTGGPGVDTFQDTWQGLNGDHITDLHIGDRIQFTNLSLADSQIQVTDTGFTFTGGSLTVDGLGAGRLVVRPINSNAGFEIRLQSAASNDFNGDGRSDILWRNDDGRLSDWLGLANGGYQDNAPASLQTVPTSWHVGGTGDFNGDGRVDILWRNDDGTMADWLGQSNGSFVDNGGQGSTWVPTSWHIAGTGDFNGDGRDDILWRNDDGTMADWLGLPNGGFMDNGGQGSTWVPTSWKVVGTGDFNGDGHDDILWRNDDGRITNWLGLDNGGFRDNAANGATFVPNAWHVAGTGDFNRDGRDDILWRNDDGRITDWLGLSNGGFFDNANNGSTAVPNSWHVQGIGDYNGDGSDDVLWRNDNGRVTNWLGQTNGGFFDNAAVNAGVTAPTSWHPQPDHGAFF